MKHMKKMLSLVLVMAMTLAIGIVTFAENTKGTITINNALNGAEYKIYKIFTLESYVKEQNLYSYTVSDKWKSFFELGGKGLDYVTITENGYVKWKDNADAKNFAKDAIAFAKTSNISNDGIAEEVTGTSVDSSAKRTVTFNNLDLGYYLVDSTVGTLCSLDTTNPTVTIEDKNKAPENEKTVKENADYGKVNDTEIYKEVEFKSVITVKDGTENYVFHDKMQNGMTYVPNSVTVKTIKKGQTGETSINANGNYTFKTSDKIHSDCTFEIVFLEDFRDSLNEDDQIVIEYKATLSPTVAIGEALLNESKVTYGGDNEFETTFSQTRTYTWGIDIYKYTGTEDNKTPLANAVFVLYRANTNGVLSDPVYFSKIGETYTVSVKADSVSANTINENAKITTDNTGRVTLKGLDEGIYYLKEEAAPQGYNKLASPVKIEIISTPSTSEGITTLSQTVKQDDVSLAQGTTGTFTIEIKNESGAVLPSTGGIGTTIFYVIGGILVVGAGILLVTKRRMKSH